MKIVLQDNINVGRAFRFMESYEYVRIEDETGCTCDDKYALKKYYVVIIDGEEYRLPDTVVAVVPDYIETDPREGEVKLLEDKSFFPPNGDWKKYYETYMRRKINVNRTHADYGYRRNLGGERNLNP